MDQLQWSDDGVSPQGLMLQLQLQSTLTGALMAEGNLGGYDAVIK